MLFLSARTIAHPQIQVSTGNIAETALICGASNSPVFASTKPNGASVKLPRLTRVAIVAALGSSVFLNPAMHAQNAGNVRVARLSRAEGQVLISHAGSSTYEEAPVNLPLQQGDILATQTGFAEVEFEDGATAYLAQNSVLQFTQLIGSNEGRATELNLTEGTATFHASLTNQDSFRVQTLILQVTVPANAEFRVDAFMDGAAVQVLVGSVNVSTTRASTVLDKGQGVAVREKDFQDFSIGRLPYPDTFDQWVTQQGELIRSGNKNTLQYLQSPTHYGLSDLAIYGSWTSFSEFAGFAWRPFGVGLSWTPYFNGTWRLDPILGWIWVSNEQWGWMPYHFGSWLLSPVLGWVWVPGPAVGFGQWQAARVNWLTVGNRVGWVAISPNDRPGVPVNAAHGVVVTSTGPSESKGTEKNEILSGKDLRTAVPLQQPPQNLVFRPSLGSSGLGTRSTIRIVPRAMEGSDLAGGNPPSHLFPHNGNPPVAPAIPMPRFGSEIPRVTQLPGSPVDSQFNRDFPPSSYLPAPASNQDIPTYETRPAKPLINMPPNVAPRPVVRPNIPTTTLGHPVIGAAPPSQSSAPRPAPSRPSPAHSAPKPASPAAPAHH